MALRTESEITTAVQGREKDLQELRDRFESDYGLWRLTPYKLGADKEYDNYTSNEPRNLANKVSEILATAPLQIRIPLKSENEEERKQISSAERFVYGCLNLADSRLMSTVQPTIQKQKGWYSAVRGWYALRVFIHKTENKETIPDIAVWDLLHTTWDTGATELLWVCHTRSITAAQAKAEYGVETKGKTGKLYDFWDNEINAVIINKTFVKEPTAHKLKHIPILISNTGSNPFIQSDKYQDTIKDWGESVYGANRNIYEPSNKLATYLLTKVGLGVHAPIGVWSSGGKKTLEKNPYYKGAVLEFDSDKGEKAAPILEQVMPKDYAALMAFVSREKNMGGIPPVAFGELDFQLPGYGINLLTHAALSVLAGGKGMMESSYEWLARELLTQYSQGGFGKLRLHGRDGSNEYFDMEATAKDIKGDWFPEAKLLPSLPEDEAGKFAMMQAAVKERIFSRETARDKLGVQDTDAEAKKVWREQAEMLPSVQVRKIVHALIEDGRPDLANEVLTEYKRSLAPKSNGAQEEAVRPEYATGMPGTVLPPEEMGRVQLPPEQREQMTQDLKLKMINLERGR